MSKKDLKTCLRTVVLMVPLFTFFISAAQDIPDKPNPPRLVNDFAGLLESDEVASLTSLLVAFNDSTSTQIAIVIVPSLQGYDVADYAQRLGEKWGIGRKGLNNGVLILLKPKTADSGGKVNISPGYGLEGIIPDITCSEIIDKEMIPSFRKDDYFTGLNNAVRIIMGLARREFTAEQYGSSAPKATASKFPFGLIIFIIVIIAILSGRSRGGNNRNISSRGLPFWLLLSMMNSGRGSHHGSWGGFSGGGGGGGGFGGFGGGSFGGGGASGSW